MSGFDLSNFLASFFDEARERLSSINQALVKFESGSLTEEGMVALRRDAHTIKGSALMLGVTDIGETAHLFEDLMEQVIKHVGWRKNPAIVQFLYDIHDVLDDRLKNIDDENTIDVSPLRTKQEHLIAHIDEVVESDLLAEENAIKVEDNQEKIANVQSDAIGILKVSDDADDNTAIDLADDSLESDEISFENLSLGMPDDTVVNFSSDINDEPEPEPAALSSELIGAGEAEAWKKQQQIKKTNEQLEHDRHLLKDTLDSPENSSQNKIVLEAIKPKETSNTVEVQPTLSSNQISFRPDIEQMEMNTTAQRKSSGRFLRVDAERLETLSNQVIELSTQQARDEAFETQFNQLSKHFRVLQRDFQDFSQSIQ
ncbi:MAG: Hpt domain-containing protein, partial [Mariprofundaceae bacterium]|nr:Hpt domain-containing protein [Mariprofundaceae bacterium]